MTFWEFMHNKKVQQCKQLTSKNHLNWIFDAGDNEMLSKCPSGWILSEIKLALKNSSENSRIVKVSIWNIAFLEFNLL